MFYYLLPNYAPKAKITIKADMKLKRKMSVTLHNIYVRYLPCIDSSQLTKQNKAIPVQMANANRECSNYSYEIHTKNKCT